MAKFSRAEVAYGLRRSGATRSMYNDLVDAVRYYRGVDGRAGQRIVALERRLPDIKRAVARIESGGVPAEVQTEFVSSLADARNSYRSVKAARMARRQHPDRASVYVSRGLVDLLKVESALR